MYRTNGHAKNTHSTPLHKQTTPVLPPMHFHNFPFSTPSPFVLHIKQTALLCLITPYINSHIRPLPSFDFCTKQIYII